MNGVELGHCRGCLIAWEYVSTEMAHNEKGYPTLRAKRSNVPEDPIRHAPFFQPIGRRVSGRSKKGECNEPFCGEGRAAEHRRAKPEERSGHPEVIRSAPLPPQSGQFLAKRKKERLKRSRSLGHR